MALVLIAMQQGAIAHQGKQSGRPAEAAR